MKEHRNRGFAERRKGRGKGYGKQGDEVLLEGRKQHHSEGDPGTFRHQPFAHQLLCGYDRAEDQALGSGGGGEGLCAAASDRNGGGYGLLSGRLRGDRRVRGGGAGKGEFPVHEHAQYRLCGHAGIQHEQPDDLPGQSGGLDPEQEHHPPARDHHDRDDASQKPGVHRLLRGKDPGDLLRVQRGEVHQRHSRAVHVRHQRYSGLSGV